MENRARVCGCKQAKVCICLRPPKTRTCCFHVLWTSGGNVFVFQCVTTVGENCPPIQLNTRGRQTTRHGLFNDELHWTWPPQLHTTFIRINAIANQPFVQESLHPPIDSTFCVCSSGHCLLNLQSEMHPKTVFSPTLVFVCLLCLPFGRRFKG